MDDNDFLEQLKHERPLHDSWVKKDFLSHEECIYVFYAIEPFTQNEKMQMGIQHHEWEFIKSFDFLRLYDMLLSSYLIVHYQNAILTAKLPKLRFHDLRHTAASHLAMAGAFTVEIATILGHA